MSDIDSIAKSLLQVAENGPISDTDKQKITESSDDNELFMNLLKLLKEQHGKTFDEGKAAELRRQLDAQSYFKILRTRVP